MHISGLVRFGTADSLGGATLAGFQLPTAQRLLGKVGKLDEIRVSAKPGVSPPQLVPQIRTVLPPDAQVRTGAQQARRTRRSVNSFLSSLKTILLVFGGVALFVGSFVIANSLSITIAQRTREFATLRTLGASRRQVLRVDPGRVAGLAPIASVVGLLVGLALAQGLFALFNAVGFTLPNSGTVVLSPGRSSSRSPSASLVTVLASLRPAMRATRVEPIAAVREGATLPEGRFARYRTAWVGDRHGARLRRRPPSACSWRPGPGPCWRSWGSERCWCSSASRSCRRASCPRWPASSAGRRPRRPGDGPAGAGEHPAATRSAPPRPRRH